MSDPVLIATQDGAELVVPEEVDAVLIAMQDGTELVVREEVDAVLIAMQDGTELVVREEVVELLEVQVQGPGATGPAGASHDGTELVVREEVLELLEVQAQGPTGPQGATGPTGPQGATGPAGNILTYTAGEALGGHRMVVLDASQQAVYADQSDVTHVDKVLGMTTGAVSGGASATLQTYGELTEPSWSWTQDTSVFLSTAGQLTQTPPTAGFLLQIGFPISPTKLFIDIKQAVLL